MSEQVFASQRLTLTQALQLPERSAIDARELEQLVRFVLNCTHAFLRTYPDFELTEQQTAQFITLRQLLIEGVPLAYVLGTQAFWTLELKVTPATLIPRPDTEIVIETILALLPKTEKLNVLDLGTGTGAIALSLSKECPQWQVTATDFSSDALAIAQENAVAHDLNHVRFLQGSWFEALSNDMGQFDLIVSNPPYIDPADPHVAALTHEPLTALVAAESGLADLRTIIQHAPKHLHGQGWLVLEHGYDQGHAVRALLTIAGFDQVRTVRDYGGNERVSLGRLPFSIAGGRNHAH